MYRQTKKIKDYREIGMCYTCIAYNFRTENMLAIRLPKEIESRLESLAKSTGRTKTYYAREAIVEHLDDLEDIYLAEQTLERIRKGEEDVLTAEEFWRELDD